MKQRKPTRAEQKRARKRWKQQQRRSGCCGIMVTAVLLILFVALCRFLDPEIGAAGRLNTNPYGPEDFAISDGYVQCTAGQTRLGIDVSEYQEQIDWKQVRDAGFDFAIIRIGYRGYTSGQILEDDLARENLKGARAAGLDVGVYFYSQSISPEEAAEEARWCLEFLDGTRLDLPVVYDWEYVSTSARTGSVTRSTLTECAQVFCDAVAAGGYDGMIYFNSHVSRDLLDLEQLQNYPWWLAQYTSALDYPHRIDFWQYTETGSVPGIKGNVDIDIMFLY